MAEYFVELYVSGEDRAAASSEEQACAAAEELTGDGVPVRYVTAIFVPPVGANVARGNDDPGECNPAHLC